MTRNRVICLDDGNDPCVTVPRTSISKFALCRTFWPFDMTKHPPRPAQIILGVVALALGGCSTGAPSFVLFGAFFPAWLLCGTLGIVGACVARAVLVASGLSEVLPYQLFVCTAAGVIVALCCWFIGFGQ
jgi:YtcA family